MVRTIKSLLSGMLFCIALISCQKEYSVENGSAGGASGTAVFTFAGAPGACTSPVINGIYQAGTTMGSGNTIILPVNVATIGTYTITTNQANGVSFKASGVFSATGPQTIQLTGTGTPTAAVTSTYTPGINGCAFGITFTAPGGGGTNGGTAKYTCNTISATGVYTAGIPLDASNTLVLSVNVTTAGTYTITTGLSDNFSFSGSGTLAVGNNQTIVLAGSGNPNVSGTVNIQNVGNGCTVAINVAMGSGSGAVDFLKATIAGTVTQFNMDTLASLDNPIAGPSSLFIEGKLTSTGNDGLIIVFANNTGLISIGSYTNISVTNTNKYADIVYSDNMGNTYAHNPISPIVNTVTLSTLSAINSTATGTFSGTLTIIDPVTQTFGTATKVITNGSFNVTF